MLETLKIIKIKSPWINLTSLINPLYLLLITTFVLFFYPLGKWLIPNDYQFILNIASSFILFVVFIFTLISYFYIVIDDENLQDFFLGINDKIEKSLYREKEYYIDLQAKYSRILPDEIGNNNYIFLCKSNKELTYGIPNHDRPELTTILTFIILIGHFSFNDIGKVGFLFYLIMLTSIMFLCINFIYFSIIEKNPITSIKIDRENWKLNAAVPILCIFIILYITKLNYVKFYGEKRIGSFFELKAYETEYYVEIIKKNNLTISDNKEPILAKAFLKVFNIEHNDGYIDDNGESESYSVRNVQITKIILPSGVELDFEKPNYSNKNIYDVLIADELYQNCLFEIDESKSIVDEIFSSIEKMVRQISGNHKSPNVTGYCTDSNGNDWQIKLTGPKVDDK
ncbi:MAG: hypothetical protein MH472_02930 [Bacteroidia bacterium]|nr:hypothetical protein [Bacteroidia bacterium]